MNEQCRRYQESLGEPALPEEFVRHGETCKSCRGFAQAQQALQRALPSWREPEFSADFALSVMSQLAEEGAKRRAFGDLLHELLHFRLSIPLPIGAMASLLLIISLSLNFAFWPQSLPEIQKAPFQIAANAGGKSLTSDSAAVFTPKAIPAANEKNSENENSAWIIPREFLGAGAFLLVPIIDGNHPIAMPQNEIKKQPDSNRGI